RRQVDTEGSTHEEILRKTDLIASFERLLGAQILGPFNLFPIDLHGRRRIIASATKIVPQPRKEAV
ncbi:hypothetical protein, partial [Thermus oshimai]